MKIIHEMLEALEDELEGAEEYSEKFIENKARNNMTRANKFKEMAMDEMKHFSYLHEMFVQDIDEIKRVYTMTETEAEAWEHGHKHLLEKMAMVKGMLNY